MDIGNDVHSFYAALRKVAGDGKAISDSAGTVTFSALVSAVDAYAEKLMADGVTSGTHVALWAVNSADWLVAFFAIQRIGGIAVLLNYNLLLSDIKVLCCNTDVTHICYGVNRETASNPKAAYELGVEYVTDITGCARGSCAISGAYQDISLEESMNKPAFIIFTTGTTSAPKAVLLSQYGFINDARNLTSIVDNPCDCAVCAAIPFFHCYGLMTTLAFLLYGCHVTVPKSFKPGDVIPALYKGKANTLLSVGTVFSYMTEHPDFDKISVQISLCVTGGGAITQTQLMRLETAFKNARFINGYGQTEASTLISVPRPTDTVEQRSQTVGKPYAGKTVRIMDYSKTLLEDGNIGEVVVLDEGNVMKGYYNLPADMQAIDSNGYLHTGDLGYIDKDGFLHLAGRIKDIIIKGGENISPAELESELTKIDNIREAKVLGAANPVYGESIEACVVCFDNDKHSEENVLAHMRGAVGSFKTPAHIFVFDSFPLNANNKLDRRALHAAMLSRLHLLDVANALNSGISVAELTIKNTAYNIVPVAAMIETLALSIGFGTAKAGRIRLAAEEMLTERIINAYENVGDIIVSVMFMSGSLRIVFTDGGQRYDIHKDEKTNISAQILMSFVDSFTTISADDGKASYALDFIYESEFDMRGFLIAHEKN